MCKYKLFLCLFSSVSLDIFEPLVPLVAVFIQQPIVLSPAHSSTPVFKVFISSFLVTNLFLRFRRLCSEDSDFSFKSEEMCNFFDKRVYPASVVQAGHPRAQQTDRQSALQTSQKENNNGIPFTLTTTR